MSVVVDGAKDVNTNNETTLTSSESLTRLVDHSVDVGDAVTGVKICTFSPHLPLPKRHIMPEMIPGKCVHVQFDRVKIPLWEGSRVERARSERARCWKARSWLGIRSISPNAEGSSTVD